jgi:hypothetical protein
MILIIRGHIRDSFKNLDLYNFLKKIYDLNSDLKIFIHTWNIISNNISWRHINIDDTNVNEEIIYNYFDDLKKLIEYIIIDDDSKVELIGNLNGTINNNLLPIICWKRYWYGKYKIIEYIYNKNIYNNEMTINTRFDLLNNSNNFDEKVLIDFIKRNIGIKFIKNKFLFEEEFNGIDNIYIGNIKLMYKLIKYFHYNLDNILIKNTDVWNQEKLVYRINNFLFSNNIDLIPEIYNKLNILLNLIDI